MTRLESCLWSAVGVWGRSSAVRMRTRGLSMETVVCAARARGSRASRVYWPNWRIGESIAESVTLGGMKEMLQSVAGRAGRYLEEIRERRVAPAAEAVARLDRFQEALPEGPMAPAD